MDDSPPLPLPLPPSPIPAPDPFLLDPVVTAPTLPLSIMLRAARHAADLSQRELAAKAGVSKSCLGDIESGDVSSPGYLTVLRLVEAAGLRLLVVDRYGMPLYERPLDQARDRAQRRWPAHLDVREVRDDWDWWFGRMRPGQRPLPKFTAEWRRLQGCRRVRRTKGQRPADQAARNTPPAAGMNATDGEPG